jgi:hypothetical protein
MGVQVDKAEVFDYLLQRGVPERLIRASLEEQMEEKLNTAMDFYDSRDVRVFIVTGPSSEKKDIFVVKMLERFVSNNKHVQYAMASNDIELKGAHVNAFMGADLVTGHHTVSKLIAFMRSGLAHGRVFILGVPSKERLEAVYGPDFVDFISHHSLVVGIDMKRSSIPKI